MERHDSFSCRLLRRRTLTFFFAVVRPLRPGLLRTALLAVLAAGLVGPPVFAEPPADSPEEDGWTFEWSNGFKLTSPDGETSLKLGGRIQSDWAFFDAEPRLEASVGPLVDGTEFRRARLFVEGTLWDTVEFKAQYDFAGGTAEFKDVYLGLVNLPAIGGFRVGHTKEPFSFEELTSSKYILFMERATPVEAFAPSRNDGFLIGQGATGEDARVTWRLGAFKDVDDFGDRLSEEWNFTGRLTGLPLYRDGGRRLIHLGLAASLRSPLDGRIRFNSRPESHLAPRFVDTGDIAADGATLLGVEALAIRGPLTFQGEWIGTEVDALAGPDPTFDGYYVALGWILAHGYHHPYSTEGAHLDRLKVEDGDRFRRGGWGVWELVGRYSSLDLTDAAVAGGELDDWTLGLNGYLFSNVRTTFNYVHADFTGVGTSDALQMRFQIDF
jgi:phosphate-selective porin OprO/OprP